MLNMEENAPYVLLERIQSRLESYRELVKFIVSDSSKNFDLVYLRGYSLCEEILKFVAIRKGYKLNNDGLLEYAGWPPISIMRPFGNYIIGAKEAKSFANDLVPKECQKFLMYIRETRNISAHHGPAKEMSIEFARAIDYFTQWFKEEYIVKLDLDPTVKSKWVARFFSLEDILSSSKIAKSSKSEQTDLLQLIASQTELLKDMLAKANAIEERTQNIEKVLSDIQKNITILCDTIVDYQSLITKQIELAQSDAEVDRLLHAYTEECTNRIVKTIEINQEEQSYKLEKRKLVASLGEQAWDKLDEASRSFLISAKVMFNNLILLDDSLDYSGVCLLVTKALEVELNNRFCKRYLSYLQECYGENYSEYPTALIGPKGTPLPLEKFTMGSYAFILCGLKKKGDTEKQQRKNKKRLMEYTSQCILKGLSKEEIEKKLCFFASNIEDIRHRFRNPAAHTNTIRRCDAEDCFSIVLDVEKLLKKMMDSFVE